MSKPAILDSHDLWKKVLATRFTMLTAHAPEGRLDSRPMTIQSLEDPGTLWFFAADGSAVAEQVDASPDVNVAVANPDDDLYVSIVGRAAIVRDRAKAAALWNAAAKAWFPGGIDDPRLVLIRVDVSHADYWNTEESKMVQFFKMAQAAITGHPPTDLGEHGRVSVSDRTVER